MLLNELAHHFHPYRDSICLKEVNDSRENANSNSREELPLKSFLCVALLTSRYIESWLKPFIRRAGRILANLFTSLTSLRRLSSLKGVDMVFQSSNLFGPIDNNDDVNNNNI